VSTASTLLPKRVGTLPVPLRPIKSSIELENRVAKTRLHAACLQMVHSSFGIVGEGSISGLAMFAVRVLEYMIWARLLRSIPNQHMAFEATTNLNVGRGKLLL